MEDRAHEGFIKAFTERIAEEENIQAQNIFHDVRSARGGSRVMGELKRFFKDAVKMQILDIDLLIVAVDGNCKGHNEKIKELEKCLGAKHPLRDKVVYAVPDPHIERWYLMDQRAFKEGLGINKAPALPGYKCKKDYYKQILNETLLQSNINALLGGAEYAENIVGKIEKLETLIRQDRGVQDFVDGIRRLLRVWKREAKRK